MLKKFNLLSVNQLSAQIKLQEVWKAVHIEKYGVSLDPYSAHQDVSGRVLRPQPNRIFNDTTRLVLAEHSFHVDAAKLWNTAPINVTNASRLRMAKKAILEHVLNMPI